VHGNRKKHKNNKLSCRRKTTLDCYLWERQDEAGLKKRLGYPFKFRHACVAQGGRCLTLSAKQKVSCVAIPHDHNGQ
jgi:hypothetical protein